MSGTGSVHSLPEACDGGTATMSAEAFLERALVSNREWTRFADPKALGVVVILGLGLTDLVVRDVAGQVWELSRICAVKHAASSARSR